ncbi:hypothetical protein ACQPW1_10395 [Nocardia sp. CA-128927]|uniref:hypothetical protein n=1 Tax=Nocardia sp. CA-128927 TaxID=3239975 RepID=UPI003D9982EF
MFELRLNENLMRPLQHCTMEALNWRLGFTLFDEWDEDCDDERYAFMPDFDIAEYDQGIGEGWLRLLCMMLNGTAATEYYCKQRLFTLVGIDEEVDIHFDTHVEDDEMDEITVWIQTVNDHTRLTSVTYYSHRAMCWQERTGDWRPVVTAEDLIRMIATDLTIELNRVHRKLVAA